MLNNINRFSTLLGFEKTLTPMRAAKAKQTLGKRYRYTIHDDNMTEIGKEILSEAELIVFALQEGRKPGADFDKPCSKCKESYCVGDDACTKGKTTYHMWGDRYGTGITKTGYDFAQWLVAEGLTSFDVVQRRIDDELAEEQKREREAAQSALELQAAQEAEETAENEYKSWLRDAVKNYGGINTPEGAKILILRDIFLDIIGEYHDNAITLLVEIDNINNPRCRRDLISRLHSGNPASIKTFEHITGIKLAKTNKERAAQLAVISKADFAEYPKQYKPRKTSEKADYNSVFYKKRFSGDAKTIEFVEARGRLWTYNGYEFFITVSEIGSKYTITEGKTGLLASRGDTLKDAQDAVRKLVNRDTAPMFADLVNDSIVKDGISPLYR